MKLAIMRSDCDRFFLGLRVVVAQMTDKANYLPTLQVACRNKLTSLMGIRW